jgi:hypothetical protein
MSGPDLRELFGNDVSAQELAKLERVALRLHAAGPLPEEPLALEWAVMRVARPSRPRHRLRLRLSVAAASTAVAAAVVGVLFSGGGLPGGGAEPAFAQAFTLQPTKAAKDAWGTVRVTATEPESGNYTIELEVGGLPHLTGKDYYLLGLGKDGQYEEFCGTFNVGEGTTIIRMVAAYRVADFDEWIVSEALPHSPSAAMPPRLLGAPIDA